MLFLTITIFALAISILDARAIDQYDTTLVTKPESLLLPRNIQKLQTPAIYEKYNIKNEKYILPPIPVKQDDNNKKKKIKIVYKETMTLKDHGKVNESNSTTGKSRFNITEEHATTEKSSDNIYTYLHKGDEKWKQTDISDTNGNHTDVDKPNKANKDAKNEDVNKTKDKELLPTSNNGDANDFYKQLLDIDEKYNKKHDDKTRSDVDMEVINRATDIDKFRNKDGLDMVKNTDVFKYLNDAAHKWKPSPGFNDDLNVGLKGLLLPLNSSEHNDSLRRSDSSETVAPNLNTRLNKPDAANVKVNKTNDFETLGNYYIPFFDHTRKSSEDNSHLINNKYNSNNRKLNIQTEIPVKRGEVSNNNDSDIIYVYVYDDLNENAENDFTRTYVDPNNFQDANNAQNYATMNTGKVAEDQSMNYILNGDFEKAKPYLNVQNIKEYDQVLQNTPALTKENVDSKRREINFVQSPENANKLQNIPKELSTCDDVNGVREVNYFNTNHPDLLAQTNSIVKTPTYEPYYKVIQDLNTRNTGLIDLTNKANPLGQDNYLQQKELPQINSGSYIPLYKVPDIFRNHFIPCLTRRQYISGTKDNCKLLNIVTTLHPENSFDENLLLIFNFALHYELPPSLWSVNHFEVVKTVDKNTLFRDFDVMALQLNMKRPDWIRDYDFNIETHPIAPFRRGLDNNMYINYGPNSRERQNNINDYDKLKIEKNVPKDFDSSTLPLFKVPGTFRDFVRYCQYHEQPYTGGTVDYCKLLSIIEDANPKNTFEKNLLLLFNFVLYYVQPNTWTFNDFEAIDSDKRLFNDFEVMIEQLGMVRPSWERNLDPYYVPFRREGLGTNNYDVNNYVPDTRERDIKINYDYLNGEEIVPYKLPTDGVDYPEAVRKDYNIFDVISQRPKDNFDLNQRSMGYDLSTPSVENQSRRDMVLDNIFTGSNDVMRKKYKKFPIKTNNVDDYNNIYRSDGKNVVYPVVCTQQNIEPLNLKYNVNPVKNKSYKFNPSDVTKEEKEVIYKKLEPYLMALRNGLGNPQEIYNDLDRKTKNLINKIVAQFKKLQIPNEKIEEYLYLIFYKIIPQFIEEKKLCEKATYEKLLSIVDPLMFFYLSNNSNNIS